MPFLLVRVGASPVLASAQEELMRGVRGMLGKSLRAVAGLPPEGAIVLGTLDHLPSELHLSATLNEDGFWLKSAQVNGARYLVVTGQNDRGVLYGAFALLRLIALSGLPADLDYKEEPRIPVRWINQWDNLDGTIERGYGGPSIFWENGRSRKDLGRVGEYARLLASIGINGCSINNVNADARLLTPDGIAQAARIAEVFRAWGIRVALSLDFSSPKAVGGLDTFDPLDSRVEAFWKSKVDEVYRLIPDLGGFVLKADSEGRLGPSAYGRTHADAANVLARALKPHGGLLFYRGFVYDHHMDWRNLKNDRARAAYDNFHNLDGKFEDNVVIQVKHGPIDFQVREPASPLFGALPKSKEAIELQITQEYMGQGRHMVYLVPMWKEALDFNMGAAPVKRLVTAFSGVANVGLGDTWFDNHLSQANLYGFGRLAWNPDLSSERIIDEWTRLTFGADPQVVNLISKLQLRSWRAYEDYTGPLGLQTLTDIVGNHYGVSVEASEGNGWGQWHRADAEGVGMDRTMATGTGYTGQYPPAAAKMFESLDTCPDALLLFFHHVPYRYVLHSGKTVIQTIYDTHYEGAETAARNVSDWELLRGRVDESRFVEILNQLSYQAGQAQVWRDAVSNWFLRASGIPDEKRRVGIYPGRYEAEAMTLDGYREVPVEPWETASGGNAVACAAGSTCSATFRFAGESGWYDLRVQYFDQNNGVSRFRVFVDGRQTDEWLASDHVPTKKMDGSSSARRTISGVALRRGDAIRIEGLPDAGEPAGLDYVEIVGN
jgi:alpha-glucuronidase